VNLNEFTDTNFLWLEEKLYFRGYVNSWIPYDCQYKHIMYIWGEIFVEFFILWFDTINEFHENWYTMNYNKSTVFK